MAAISGPVLGGLLAIAGILLTAFFGILAWVIRKLLDVEEEVGDISQSYGGGEYNEGHLNETRKSFERVEQRLDDFEDSLGYYERARKESHQEICSKIDSIVEVLREEGFNGNLDNIEPSDD